jgi:hypothetical protein
MSESPVPHAATVPAVTASGALAPQGGATVFLGTLAPEIADIDRLVRTRRAAVAQSAHGAPDPRAILYAHDVLDFETYLHTVENFTKLAKELHQTGALARMDVTAAMRRVLNMPMLPRAYTADEEGWKTHLCDTNPAFRDEIDKLSRPSAFPERTREGHTLVVAPSNWGKSELLKALIHHQVNRGDAAVVVLDPGKDMAGQIARWPELANSDRLIYVEPELAAGYTVGLNPFDGAGLDERNRSIVAAMLATAVENMAGELSPNMKNLAMNCLTVLLDRPGSTLRDFLLLMRHDGQGRDAARPKHAPPPGRQADRDRRKALLEAGRSHPRWVVSSFFEEDLYHSHYETSRSGLRSRFMSLIALADVEAMLDGPATLDLEAALNARKVIVVNLGKFGDGGADLGRLIVALVAAIGRRRGVNDDTVRVPVHLFVDEATTMVSPEMVRVLAELRKFGIHQTLAQQVGGEKFTAEQKAGLFKNTAVKILAPTDAEAARLAGLSSAEAAALPKLDRGEFWVQWGHGEKLARLKVRRDLADNSHSVTDGEWQACVKRQLAAYYRPSRPEPPQPAGAPADDPPPKIGSKRLSLKRGRA